MDLDSLLIRVHNCDTWRSLYKLSEAFIENGMVLVPTVNGSQALCRVESGYPKHDRIFDDYVFVESNDINLPIPRSNKLTLIEFIKKAASVNKLSLKSTSYFQNVALYGRAIHIVNETDCKSDQTIADIGGLLDDL